MRFNLSEWALENRGIVVYFMVLLAVLGGWSYLNLGQSEDPPFTFRVMVVNTFWPGATASEVEQQVTDRIEEKLQESQYVDFLRSYSRPGESQVFFLVRDDIDPRIIADAYYQVRKKIGDIRHRLPPGVQGPFFNDEFGDTFGNIYALTGRDYSAAELEDYAERIRARLLRVQDVAKVEFFGVQEERIEIRIDNVKRGELGVPAEVIFAALQGMNNVQPAGFFEVGGDRIYLRTTGAFRSAEDVRNAPVTFAGRTVRVGDVAEVHRGYADPPSPSVRFGGEPAIGIGVSMEKGGDIIRLGKALDAEFARIQAGLPLGLSLDRVADQPRAVRRGVSEFVRVLAEAVAIVLLVSFFSLGFRTGLVVALSIPLVLAMTFAAMKYFSIDLHKISLGALVLALGLLVDDAIIAVEMMAVKMEQGWDRVKAASFAYTSTAFPMLTGTLVTAAGFLPIATAASSTGEYTRSIFQVVTIALVISWLAAVIFVPYLGYRLLPDFHRGRDVDPGSHDPYQTPFYARARRVIAWCVDHRFKVIGLTVALFVVSVGLFRFVPQQFFPASARLELLVDLKLAEGASLDATHQAAQRLEQLLEEQDGIEHYVGYVGSGAPRFYLPLDQQLPAASFAQYVLNTASIEDRERLRALLVQTLPQQFPDLRWRVLRLEQGPPVGYPVQFRVSGEDPVVLHALADRIATVMRDNPHAANVHLDWDEPSKIVRLVIDQDRAQALGVSSESVAQYLQSSLNGGRVTLLREQNKLIEVVFRGPPDERALLSLLESTSIPRFDGPSIALNQIARLEYTTEPGITWRRNRLPTVTARADVYTNVQAPVVTAQILPLLEPIRADLPPGYVLETGGTVEESAKGQRSVNAGMPLLVLTVLTLLMFQLKRFSLVALVVLTAPLGIIGVSLFMLALQQPFGFVAMLGTIALSGMIMRNSVILVDQIEHDLASGISPHRAVVGATVRRLRPIVLTAAAAVLAMIPLSRSVFFGPMAVAIMGGLIAATALTLLFLPALYAAWFRVPPDDGVPARY
ncbi:MAG: efflux RND transporter permease subunit [Gammaproteobacteria bacterium]